MSRKAFNAWHGGRYRGLQRDIAWAAWQASAMHEREACAATCVTTASPKSTDFSNGYNMGALDCESSIRARNLQDLTELSEEMGLYEQRGDEALDG